MKRDPYPNPIDLGKAPQGGWKFVEPKTGFIAVHHNFWRLAQLVIAHRKANRLPAKSFDDVQTEILCYIRSEAGLKCDGTVAAAESTATPSPVQQFIQKTYKRGCRSCGGRR